MNLIELNDWGMGRFLKVVIALQLAVLGLAILATQGLDVPVIQQLIGFIYLTFIPGAIILRIFKLHRLGTIRTLMYTVGLSLAFLMFIGLFINVAYPAIGISKPISPLPVIITITAATLLMCFLAYRRDRDYSPPPSTGEGKMPLPPVLFLTLLPILSLLGARMVDIYGNNKVLLLLMALIALTVGLIAFSKFIPREMYPLAILMISISLLTHVAASSPYLWGSDIQMEHYFYKLVEANHYWNPDFPISPGNVMLSLVTLPAMYHYLAGISSMHIFKMAYPVIFSLVPLGLYQVCHEQTDEKTAFLATFFFMSFPLFFNTMLILGKQQIAEFFIVCLILLILDKRMDSIKRPSLLIIFGASLVVAHYALSYIFIAYLILGWLIVYVIGNFKKGSLTGTYVVLLTVMALSWYIYTSSSITFSLIVDLAHQVYTGIRAFLLFAPEASHRYVLQAIGILPMPSFLLEISRILFWVTNLFIIAGIGELIFFKKFRKTNLTPEYIAFSLVTIVLLVAAIVLPWFIVNFDGTRLYHIALIFLSPFCILGGRAIVQGMRGLFRLGPSRGKLGINPLILIVLMLYFLLNTGFIGEVTKSPYPTSIPLSMNRMEQSEHVELVTFAYHVNIRRQSVLGVNWLSSYADEKEVIYADYWLRYFVKSYGKTSLEVQPIKETTTVGKGSYIYLGYWNVVGGRVDGWVTTTSVSSITVLTPTLEKGNLVYSNGASEIYKIYK